MAALPEGRVYAGFSFGAGTAQQFTQTRPGARGALAYESCIPIPGEWAIGPWPDGTPPGSTVPLPFMYGGGANYTWTAESW